MAECANRTVRRNLLRNLLQDYDPYVRPVLDTSFPVQVGFRFTPIISVLNELDQELQLRGMLAMAWVDETLNWIPEEYDGIKELYIPLYKEDEPYIWKPELALNESLATDFQSFQPDTMSVRLLHTGNIYWYTLATVKSLCRVEVTSYPFGSQTCLLTFTTWMYQTNEQVFHVVDDLTKSSAYKKYEVNQGVWEVTIDSVETGNTSYDCNTCEGEEQSYVTFHLTLARSNPWVLFFSLLLPCFVTSGMNILVFWLPPQNNSEAATFGLTCVLTFFVLLGYIVSVIPSTGQPLIGMYIVWLIVEGVLITIVAVYESRSFTANEGSEKNRYSFVQHLPDSFTLPRLAICEKIISTVIFALSFCVIFSLG